MGQSGRDDEAPRSAPATVYVVDDHEYVRAGLCELIDSAAGFTVIGSCGTVTAAVPDILRLRPTVAVVDDALPDGNGAEICRRVLAEAPEVDVVIVSAGVSRPSGRAEAEAAGAAAYILKRLVDFPLFDVLTRLATSRR